MSAGKPLAAVFTEAAEVIGRNGWYVGDFYDDTAVQASRPPAACPVCASGAVIVAAGGCRPDDWSTAAVVLCRFADFLVDRGEIDAAMLTGGCAEDAVDAIGAWNDAHESAEPVIAAFRAAAWEVTRCTSG